VMMRGTFANIRLRNHMLGENGREGGYTIHYPSREEMSIYDAAMQYRSEGVPLVIFAGIEYGNGSSRDWAAKGTSLLGVRAVIARSFERIHRSNLVGMGVLPLQFLPGENAASLGLNGEETFDVLGLQDIAPRQRVHITATRPTGDVVEFDAIVRIDSPVEVEYFRNGGILQTVLRRLPRSVA
jgi:aconitate hydratase